MSNETHQSNFFRETKKSFLTAVWFMVLTFPIMVIKVDTVEKTIGWRWGRLIGLGISIFFLSYAWRALMARQEAGQKAAEAGEEIKKPLFERIWGKAEIRLSIQAAVCAFAIIFPLIFSTYQTNIMITALMYVMLGLGLNIVVGLAGLLDLGYVAFYAVGAYTYALLNNHFGLGFWWVLPVGAVMGATFGILLGFPVLRLRGDYLAIVTLGFGEIIRLVLENWNAFSFGPSGISGIDRPNPLWLDKIFAGMGMEWKLEHHIIFLFYLMVGMTLLTIFVVNRLQNSRIGRAWLALREDEIACQAMGVDKVKTKLTAFALGATWAGMAGVVFAAKTTFINPASFTFMESALILSIVVLGGMGSIPGVIIGALIIILLPEYLRDVDALFKIFPVPEFMRGAIESLDITQFRMLIFGGVLVQMMVFRPGGMIRRIKRTYEFKILKEIKGERK